MDLKREGIGSQKGDSMIIAVLAAVAMIFFALSALIFISCCQNFQEFGYVTGLQFEGFFSFAMFSAAATLTLYVKSGRISFRKGRKVSLYLLMVCLLGMLIFFAVDAHAETQPGYYAYGVPCLLIIISMVIVSLLWMYFDHCLKIQDELDNFV